MWYQESIKLAAFKKCTVEHTFSYIRYNLSKIKNFKTRVGVRNEHKYQKKKSFTRQKINIMLNKQRGQLWGTFLSSFSNSI